MSMRIILMEIKRLKKNIMIGIFAPAGYAALIMVFYIAFAGVMGEMTDLFTDTSLQGLLKAFSMDANTFSYILNFYVAYNGVYVLLMGVIFAGLLGVHLFSGELNSGTYEFIYSNPISRVKVFMSKCTVIVVYLVALNLVIFIVGVTSIELLKTKSPLIPWMSETNENLVIDKLTSDYELMMQGFDLDESLFYAAMYSEMEVDNANTFNFGNTDLNNDLLETFLINPDGIYDVMIDNIDLYMSEIDNNPLSREEFITLIKIQKNDYLMKKEHFDEDPLIVAEFIRNNPKPFLEQVIAQKRVIAFSDHFGFSKKEKNKVFIYYSLNNFIELSFVNFMVMLTVAMISVFLTVLIPKGKYASGAAIGFSMTIYLMSMMSNMTEQTRVLRYFTPLAYVNMDVMAINYSLPAWSWLSMFTLIIVATISSAWVFNKSDLIS